MTLGNTARRFLLGLGMVLVLALVAGVARPAGAADPLS